MKTLDMQAFEQFLERKAFDEKYQDMGLSALWEEKKSALWLLREVSSDFIKAETLKDLAAINRAIKQIEG